MAKKKKIRRMAVAVVLFNQGKVLGVSRKNNRRDFGLPGGKLDPGETFEQAAIRETKEESGLRIFGLYKIFERVDDDFWVMTFAAQWKGKIKTTERGKVKWTTFATLKKGSFGKYNTWLEKTLIKNKFLL